MYASYQENDLMQSEKLIVSPVSNLSIWVTVKSENGGFTDDYDPPPKEEGIFGSGPITYYLEEQMGEFLTDILKSDYGVDTSLFFIDEAYPNTITDMSQVLENEEGGQDYCWNYSCHSTLWLPEGSITKMHIREIAVKAADWINQRHIMWQFDVRTLRQNIDFSELTRNNVFDQILIGHGHKDYLYSVDVFQERIHEYEGDSVLMFDYDHEDYINGKNLWYPVYVHDVMYKSEPVIEQMHWGSFEYGSPEDSFAYWVNSDSESGTLRFEELDRPLKAAGWTFYTNRENSFSWRKNNDIVRFIVEDDDEKNKGNTAQRLRRRYAVRFFGRLCRNFAGILTYVKKFMCKMPENMQVYALQSRQAVFVRCCLNHQPHPPQVEQLPVQPEEGSQVSGSSPLAHIVMIWLMLVTSDSRDF